MIVVMVSECKGVKCKVGAKALIGGIGGSEINMYDWIL